MISPSTGSVDWREKLSAYKRIPSVQAYLIVEQEERLVEWHWRKDGGWWTQEIAAQGTIDVPCPVCELSLAEICEGV